MRVAVLTMRLDPATGTFNAGELDRFHAGREVLEVGEHFFFHEQTPTLTLVIRYRDAEPARFPRPDAPARKDWRAELDPPAQALYDELRTWRGRRAKHEGMPPFLILGNRELAAVAATRPESLTALRGIDGIGTAKVERWGTEILAVLAAFGDRASPEPGPTVAQPGTVLVEPAEPAPDLSQPAPVAVEPASVETDGNLSPAEVSDAS